MEPVSRTRLPGRLAEHLGVGFISLTEALDLTTPVGQAMTRLLVIFGEFKREILRERTRAGLAHARENGQRLGRAATATVHTAEARKLHRTGISKCEIARRLNIGPDLGTPDLGLTYFPEKWVRSLPESSRSLMNPAGGYAGIDRFHSGLVSHLPGKRTCGLSIR